MKLYIRQQIFSFPTRFNVKDEDGNDRYMVEGEFFTMGRKLHVYDMQYNEVVFLSQKLMSLLPSYYVYIGDSEIMEIRREFTLLNPSYEILGMGWDVRGDFLSHDYQVCRGEEPIAYISKEWFTWGDSYCLDITAAEVEIPVLAIALAIDCVLANS